jgi:hypothetical protein
VQNNRYKDTKVPVSVMSRRLLSPRSASRPRHAARVVVRPNRLPREDTDLLAKLARGKKCGAIEGIIDEVKEIMDEAPAAKNANFYKQSITKAPSGQTGSEPRRCPARGRYTTIDRYFAFAGRPFRPAPKVALMVSSRFVIRNGFCNTGRSRNSCGKPALP